MPANSSGPLSAPHRCAHANSPVVIETPHLVSLCFDDRGMQSCMYVDGPDLLALGYTRTMMGFLLLHSEPRRIAMIGLGGGSLAKYLYRHLPDARITSIEINPDVIALRDRFRIPPDDARFSVLCADGAQYVASAGDACADVLIVDGFDAGGLPLELGSRPFYADCRRHLAAGGVLVVNLLTDDPRVADCLAALRDVFGTSAALAPAEDSASNLIVFAWKSDAPLPSLETMIERANALARGHSIDLVEAAVRIELGVSYDWRRFGEPVDA
ncbi:MULTISPECIES: spermidine synthase [Burkholderia]|uniref:Spermidine synthase n=1 Tax=Burkholderia savannae TaxID=1637837 RepID=A0ABR5T4S3_9BURK|nr:MULTISPECIES: spermidine synthase [Burkholderia]AOJ71528.1 spermidine synthase [Burkholderia savannae]AOK49923.1 spermidine synthase [Burkholderia sp. MSMB617WGS]KGS04672.1 spermine/spermidine synthase family protein [Burkholderia sp. ABCPW 111]KVG37078.1 spermidine synthase [Burkholderia sp. MSMB0265]KVG77704.1 spermidine synthase [Burkholderia sp. MSMB2040]